MKKKKANDELLGCTFQPLLVHVKRLRPTQLPPTKLQLNITQICKIIFNPIHRDSEVTADEGKSDEDDLQ